MSHSQNLIVITLMASQGETGVQTHFNTILDAAKKLDLECQLIYPYDPRVRVPRKFVTLMARLLRTINKEWAVLWTRWTHYYLIRYLLRQSLRVIAESVAIYAQDPLSARAALMERKPGNRVVTVAHFNISESYEVLTKGLTVEGGCLYKHFQENEAYTLPRVDKIIFVSAFMQKLVNERLPSIHLVPQAVISNFIHDPDRQGVPQLRNDLITIGSLEKRKNQAFILRVLAEAHARGHRYKLTIIGNGPDRLRLESLANELKLTDSITFLGFQANASGYMAGHRVYVHAALMENLPITLLEALSYGLPILAPPVGGIPEVFTDGEQGYFWSLDNVDLAVDKLCMILENNDLCEKLSEGARVQFETHFSEHVLANTWLTEISST
ncbi:glycosyltransferase family 4 protein [Methylomonas sp. 2BW1-5-20]|uniref:glycosyltransferase family 4 protein n=1 Tax=Methylomonas sp. 2BW1-5-20 TaxID=3376686 RepID=UPI00404E9916